jgi:hypothetical protein
MNIYQTQLESKCGETSVLFTGKGKAIPVQAWTGPYGSKKLGIPDFKTICT